MAILGNVIKGVINLRASLITKEDHVAAQRKVLENLLETAKDTEFGRQYRFAEILAADNMEKVFSADIPSFDYHSLHDAWWHRVIAGEENITWPGSPNYFALSSGTTGKKSKRIPVSDAMIDEIRQAGVKQVFAMSNYDLPAEFFETEMMALGSSTNLKERGDYLEGEISGITASRIPSWFKSFYKPGEEIAQMDDWDSKVAEICKHAYDWNIGVISGIPSWVELMISEVLKYHNKQNIHEIWPNLQVYTSGGVAFGPYEKSFQALMGKPMVIIDTYLASEGFIASQTRPEAEGMELITNGGIYFEFVPFEAKFIKEDGSIVDDAPVVGLDKVELEKDYILLISTVSGAWRYLIGDTIQFTNIERAEIIITGRTKFFLNVVGSQLSVNKLDKAVSHIESEYDSSVPEYTLCAKRGEDGEFYHYWYLGSDELNFNEKEVAKQLDDNLSQVNKNYKIARSKALKGVNVKIVPTNVFHEWNGSNKKKGGQVKMERVMGEDKFAEWEEFVVSL